MKLVHNVVKVAFKNCKKTRDTNKAREKLQAVLSATKPAIIVKGRKGDW